MNLFKATIFALFFSVFCSACTSTDNIKQPNTAEAIKAEVKIGDEIDVKTLDGTNHKIKVVDIKSDEIIATENGENTRIKIANIDSINKEGISIWKTTGAVVGTAYLYVLVSLIALLAGI